MIQIERGLEPDALADARARLLPRAREIWTREGTSPALKAALTGYDPDNVVKSTLFARQHRKCAYCERPSGMKSQPVEHFRPKKEAWRHRPRDETRVIDPERYWWLCWTWENLFFACQTCNGSGRKGNYFPLRPGMTPMPIPGDDPSVESTLLLDPAASGFDVRDHLRWRPVEQTAHPRRWRWQLDSLTPAGEATREILGLDSVADDVGERHRDTVWPRFEAAIDKPCRDGAPAHAIMNAWSGLCRDLVKATSPLTAATWFILDALRSSRPWVTERRLPPPQWLR